MAEAANPTAMVAVSLTLRMTRAAMEGFSPAGVDGFPAGAGFAGDLAGAAAFTDLGAAVPKLGFLASLDRSAIAAPAPLFACVLLFLGAAFFFVVAIALS
jgi:hypothetical protein